MPGNRPATNHHTGDALLHLGERVPVNGKGEELASLLLLPVELLLALFQNLDHKSLAALCRVCRSLNIIMVQAGWKDYCKANHRSTPSVSERWSRLSWSERARETYSINHAWSHQQYVSKSLNSRWRKAYHPVLALSSNRLVVGAGNTITSYRFGYDYAGGRSTVDLEGSWPVFVGRGDEGGSMDITGVEFLPGTGKDESLLVSSAGGSLVRVKISPPQNAAPRSRFRRDAEPILQASRTAAYNVDLPHIRTLASSGSIAVAISPSGAGSVVNTSSPWIKPISIAIGKVPWISHIELSSSTPYFAVGTSESVSIHAFSDGLPRSSSIVELGGPGRATPVYSICQYVPGGSPDILASGWYDGKVRIHDLRCSQKTWSDTIPGGNALAPVMTLSDPWRTFDPIYSLTTRSPMSDPTARSSNMNDGGLPHANHYLIAGSAFHSVVCLFDVRQPSDSWSLFAAGGDRSPIYSLKAEGSRVWGATQGRVFVVDFGPEAAGTRYPYVSEGGAHLAGNPYLHRYGSRGVSFVHRVS